MLSRSNIFMSWFVWGLVSFFYAYQYIIRVLPNVMKPILLEKYQIDAAILGQYSGLYYIGYAAAHIPVGILLDKYGPKWVLPICIFLTVVGLLPLLYLGHWIYPTLGRVLIGIGSSAAILGLFKIIRLYFPERQFPFMLGLAVTIGLLGAIYGGQPINQLIRLWDVHVVISGLMIIGCVLAFVIFWMLPRHDRIDDTRGWWMSVKSVLSNFYVVAICIFAGFMVGPQEGFADVWAKAYLGSVYQLLDSEAASLPSMIFLGMCFGAPVLSWIVSKTNLYYGILVLSALVMASIFIAIFNFHFSVTVLMVLFLIVGIFCAYQILAIYLASTLVPENLVALTTACANMVIMIFGYLFHGVIGKLMDMSWSGELIDGIPVYTPEAYTRALMVIPVGLLIGALGFASLKWLVKRRTVVV